MGKVRSRNFCQELLSSLSQLKCLLLLTNISRRLPPSYQYCVQCADQMDSVVARPWVQLEHNHNLLDRHTSLAPAHGDMGARPRVAESATFRRLGMKTSKGGIPDLEVSHLSPVHSSPEAEPNKSVVAAACPRYDSMKRILSPSSGEALARRQPSVRSQHQAMSRRTLQFQSPLEVECQPGRQGAPEHRQMEEGQGHDQEDTTVR